MISFELFLESIKKTFSIQGRSSRYEFLNYLFFYTIYLMLLLAFVGIFIATGQDEDIFATFIVMTFSLLLGIPSLSLSVRRIHDFNYSGWLYFLLMIPVIGLFFNIPLWFLKGKPEANKFGEAPL